MPEMQCLGQERAQAGSTPWASERICAPSADSPAELSMRREIWSPRESGHWAESWEVA